MFVSPSMFLIVSNFSHPSALVKIFPIWSFLEQCRRWVVLASTWCWIKWYFMVMCLVRSWNLGFLANLIAQVLSISRGVEFSCFSCRSSSIFFIHIIFIVVVAIATYYVSIVEYVGIGCLYRDALNSRNKLSIFFWFLFLLCNFNCNFNFFNQK